MAKDLLERIKTDLQIEEHVKTHETGFIVQKVGLILMIVFVLSAALGAFGDGVLSKKTITGKGASVEFEQFYRFEARMDLKVDVSGSDGGKTQISIENDYLDKFLLESVSPEPESTTVDDRIVHFVFAGSGPMKVSFHLVPRTFGTLNGTIGVNTEKFSIYHFIYP